MARRLATRGTPEVAYEGENPNEAVEDLLQRAGMLNLQGVEEPPPSSAKEEMAQKLAEACEVATDMKRCISDVEVKYKVVVEELCERNEELAATKAALSSVEAKLVQAEATIANLQSKGAEHWAAKKALENERDHARCEAEAAKEMAKRAQLKAEVDLKTARAEVELAREARG